MKKELSNEIMLITYPDSMGHNLKDLDRMRSAAFIFCRSSRPLRTVASRRWAMRRWIPSSAPGRMWRGLRQNTT